MADEREEIVVRLRVKDQNRFLREMARASSSVEDFGDESENTNRKLRRMNEGLSSVGKLFRLIKPVALITSLGLLAQVASGAASGLVALGSALAPLVGTLAALPALGLAAGQGFLATKLGLLGVTDAVGGLNEALDVEKLEGLSPAAQRFAWMLDSMKAPILSLQRLVQRGLFPGMERGLKAASTVLGALRPVMLGTGFALGNLAERAGLLVQSWRGDLVTVGTNNVQWIRRMGTVALELAHALRHVVVAAQPLVGYLTGTAVGWARNLSTMAQASRESGRMAAFFDKTRIAFDRTTRLAFALGGALWNIAGAGESVGNDLLKTMVKSAEAFERWTAGAGQDTLRQYFLDAQPVIMEVGRLIRDLTKAFFEIGSGQEVADVIEQFREKLLPVIVDLIKITTTEFGPVFIDALTNIALVLKDLSGAGGPLALAVGFFGDLAGGVHWLLQNFPGLTEAVSLLMAALIVKRVADFGKKLAGVGSAAQVACGHMDCVGGKTAKAGNAAGRSTGRFAKLRGILGRVGLALVGVAKWLGRGSKALIRVGVAATMALGWWAVLIAALVVGAILIYKNWDTIKARGLEMWASLRRGGAQFLKWLRRLPRRILNATAGMFAHMGRELREALTPDIGLPRIPRPSLDMPGMPGLATGGVVHRGSGSWLTGERGIEMNTWEGGNRIRVTPLAQRAVQPVAAGVGAGGATPTREIVERTPIILKVGNKVLTSTVDERVRQVKARL